MFSASGQQRNSCLECYQRKWVKFIVCKPTEKTDQRSEKSVLRHRGSFSLLVIHPQHANTVAGSPELKLTPETMGRQTHVWTRIVTNRPKLANDKHTHLSALPCLHGVCVCVFACVHCIVCLFCKRRGWKGIPYELLCFLPVHVSASVFSSSHCLLTASLGRARQHL